MQKHHQCAFEICSRRLHDFGFVCKETSNLYCDEICAARDAQEHAEKKARFLWH